MAIDLRGLAQGTKMFRRDGRLVTLKENTIDSHRNTIAIFYEDCEPVFAADGTYMGPQTPCDADIVEIVGTPDAESTAFLNTTPVQNKDLPEILSLPEMPQEDLLILARQQKIEAGWNHVQLCRESLAKCLNLLEDLGVKEVHFARLEIAKEFLNYATEPRSTKRPDDSSKWSTGTDVLPDRGSGDW